MSATCWAYVSVMRPELVCWRHCNDSQSNCGLSGFLLADVCASVTQVEEGACRRPTCADGGFGIEWL